MVFLECENTTQGLAIPDKITTYTRKGYARSAPDLCESSLARVRFLRDDMKNTHKKITILDPESWDLRYEQKRRQWYYKLSPDFFNHPLIFAVSCEAKLLFLDIIRQSQRVDKPQLSYCLDSAKGLLRGDLDLVKGALRELKDNNIIGLETNVRCQLIEENRIEENRIEANRKKPNGFRGDDLNVFDLVGQDWNKMCDVLKTEHEIKLSKISIPLSDERKKKVKLMLKILPEQEMWKKAMGMIPANSFNLGVNDRGWVANFDWFIQTKKQPYLKLYEEWLSANEN